jgi:Tfp pilus assembly protein PilV
MRTFLQTTAGRRRHGGRQAIAIAGALPKRLRNRLHGSNARDEDGFLLIEVMISALMVALIVVATFNGFDVASKAVTDQRSRDQATLLAAQSQEQLRSEPATALDALEGTPHKYTKTIGGTTYTITQEAKPVGSEGNTTGCSVTETKAQTAANFQVTSTVTWPAQVKAERPGVIEAGVVTPPTGSGIEVDVINGSGAGVEGVTARASFEPTESGTYNSVEGTTNNKGCVVLTGIQATKATVEIVPRTGFVTPSGALTVPSKVLTIAPSITTHYEVQYAEAGRIAAHFTYGGKEVKSDTFVASNSGKMQVAPEYEVGSTFFNSCEGSEELSKAATGTYLTTAETAACSRYPRGDLFPFSAAWIVYGGDCEANKDSEGEATVVVKSGETVSVKVPMSYTKLTAYKGIEASGETESRALGKVKITNSGCASAQIPNNSWGFAYTHEQPKTLAGGALEFPYQPFGAFQLCVVDPYNEKTYTRSFTNSTTAGSTPNIYLGQKTSAEQAALRTSEKTTEETLNNEESAAKTAKEARASEETAAKTAKEKRATEETSAKTAKEKREKEETEATTAKTKRTTEETEATKAREKREKEEKEAREKWSKEEKEGKISKATRESKEATQTTTRKAKEAEEKTAKEKRATEETAATKAKEKRATEETEATTAKSKRATEETEAAKAKEAREKAEAKAPGEKTEREAAKTAASNAKKATEKEEATENAGGVTVEKGTECH